MVDPNYSNHFITDIITTFAEIREILYAPDSKRSVHPMFCLRNITFLHALLLRMHLQGEIKSMTSRRFFGSYYHSLTFTFVKKTTNLTSDFHPVNVIANAMIER